MSWGTFTVTALKLIDVHTDRKLCAGLLGKGGPSRQVLLASLPIHSDSLPFFPPASACGFLISASLGGFCSDGSRGNVMQILEVGGACGLQGDLSAAGLRQKEVVEQLEASRAEVLSKSEELSKLQEEVEELNQVVAARSEVRSLQPSL